MPPAGGIGVGPGRRSWGLGDVLGGIVVAQILSLTVVVLVYGLAGWDAETQPPMWATALLQIPLWVGLVGATWLAGRKGGGLADFGWKARWMDPLIGLPVGIACQLVLLPLIYFPLLEILDISTEELAEPAQELADRATSNVGWLVLLVMVSVGAPIVEELFYRGLLLQSLVKSGIPGWFSVILSAALFAAMHFQPLQFLGLFVFGLVLAAMALWFKRLGPSIWAHVGFNATTVIVLYVGTN